MDLIILYQITVLGTNNLGHKKSLMIYKKHTMMRIGNIKVGMTTKCQLFMARDHNIMQQN